MHTAAIEVGEAFRRFMRSMGKQSHRLIRLKSDTFVPYRVARAAEPSLPREVRRTLPGSWRTTRLTKKRANAIFAWLEKNRPAKP